MLTKWWQSRAFSKALMKLNWCGLEMPPISNYENQIYSSDFIFQLSRLHTGLPGRYVSGPEARFMKIFVKRETVRREIPINDFFGSNNGKSHLAKSLNEFSQNLVILDDDQLYGMKSIRFQTDADFTSNVQRLEQRFKNHPLAAHYFPWSDRYYLDNIDCSHTLGAIYRQCREQSRAYAIICELTTWKLDPKPLEELQAEYSICLATALAQEWLSNIYYRSGGHSHYYGLNIGQTGLKLIFMKRHDRLLKGFRMFFKYYGGACKVFVPIEDLIKIEA